MQTSKIRTYGRKMLWLLVLSIAPGLVVFAETDEGVDDEWNELPLETVESARPEDSTERIQVTGSRIRRMDFETSAPITIITRESIEQSGVTSIGELFRDSASLSPTGNFSGASGFVAQGSATLNLLGLGAGRTLVLLNGRRLPVAGGNAVNVDNIPTGMIERIEVLSGGASAIYGADAVGGVINIITRRQFEGAEVTFFGSVPHNPGGREYEISAFQGTNLTNNLNLTIGGGYKHRAPIDKRDRDLAFSSFDRRFTATNPPPGEYSWRPANVVLDDEGKEKLEFGDWNPSANCPPDRQVVTVPSSPNDTYCTGPREDIRTELVPRKEEWYITATMDYTLTPSWDLTALLSYHHSDNLFDQGQFLTTSSEPYRNQNTTLSREKALELGVIGDEVEGEFFQIYAPVREMPSRRYTNINETKVAALYLDGLIGNDWAVQAGLTYSRADGLRRGENILNSVRVHENLYNQSNPFGVDPPFISIDPGRNFDLFSDAMDDLESKTRNNNFSSDVFASRPLFSLPGGDFSLGIGAGFYVETFRLSPDSRDLDSNAVRQPIYTGTFASVGRGRREIFSAFTEFFAPITRKVTVEGAFRFDHYSDFDSTLNFGLGTKVEVAPFLSLRGRAASSYTAPSLSYLHQSGGGGYFSIRDPKGCQKVIDRGGICEMSNPVRQVYVENPGNQSLKPENGMNYTAGFIFEPFHGVSLLADYYWINLNRTFQRDDLQNIVDRWYAENPDSEEGGTVNENTITVDNDAIITQVGLPYRNLGQLSMRGMDVRLNTRSTVGQYTLGSEAQYFRLFSFREQEAPDEPLRQQLSYFGKPSWRSNISLSVARDIHRIILRSRTIGRQKQDPQYATQDSFDSRVGEYTRYDVVYGATLPWNASLQLGVNNVFDTIGGVFDGNSLRSESLVSSSLYSAAGRTYFARVGVKF